MIGFKIGVLGCTYLCPDKKYHLVDGEIMIQVYIAIHQHIIEYTSKGVKIRHNHIFETYDFDLGVKLNLCCIVVRLYKTSV